MYPIHQQLSTFSLVEVCMRHCAHLFVLRNLKVPILSMGVVEFWACMPRTCRQLLNFLPVSPISKYAKREAQL